MFGKLLFFFLSSEIAISYKVKNGDIIISIVFIRNQGVSIVFLKK